MTVAVSAGVGDLESLVGEHRVGAVIESERPEALARCAEQLRELSADPEGLARCQALANELFSLDACEAPSARLRVYGQLLGAELSFRRAIRCRRSDR